MGGGGGGGRGARRIFQSRVARGGREPTTKDDDFLWPCAVRAFARMGVAEFAFITCVGAVVECRVVACGNLALTRQAQPKKGSSIDGFAALSRVFEDVEVVGGSSSVLTNVGAARCALTSTEAGRHWIWATTRLTAHDTPRPRRRRGRYSSAARRSASRRRRCHLAGLPQGLPQGCCCCSQSVRQCHHTGPCPERPHTRPTDGDFHAKWRAIAKRLKPRQKVAAVAPSTAVRSVPFSNFPPRAPRLARAGKKARPPRAALRSRPFLLPRAR